MINESTELWEAIDILSAAISPDATYQLEEILMPREWFIDCLNDLHPKELIAIINLLLGELKLCQ